MIVCIQSISAAQLSSVVKGWTVGNLAEQAVGAALRYRAYAPVLDKLLQEVGLAEHGVTGLLASAQPGVTVKTNSDKADGQVISPAPASRPAEPGKAR